MQVRSQAQKARQDSEAAALLKTADQALEDRNRQTAVQKSRELKRLKEQAAQKMKFEQAQTGYKKVSSNDMSLWANNRGGISVERERPVFKNNLGEPPAEAASQQQTMQQPVEVVEEESGGFSPFKGVRNMGQKVGQTVTQPFKKNDAEETTGLRVPDPTVAETEKKGLLKRMPKIGFRKNKDNGSAYIDPPARTTSNATVETAEKRGLLKGIGERTRNMGSKLPLIGRKNKADPPVIAGPATTAEEATVTTPPTATAPTTAGPPAVERPVRVERNEGGINEIPYATGADQQVRNPVDNAVGTVAETAETPAAMIPEEKPGLMGKMKNGIGKLNPFTKKEEANGLTEVGPTDAGNTTTGVVEEIVQHAADGTSGAAGQVGTAVVPDAAQSIAATTATVPDDAEKVGLMSRIKNIGGGGGLGRRNKVAGDGKIDAGLFPDGSTTAPPQGGELTAVDPNQAANTGPTGEFANNSTHIPLPGQKDKKKLIERLPTITLPDMSEIGKPDPTEPKVWKERGTSHKGGSSFYVVKAPTNFMKFGESQFNSEISELAAGTVVRMTKPGESWVSVQIASGAQGIVKLKDLRPASQAEVPTEFAAAPTPSYATNIMSSQPVGAPANTAPPVNLPANELPTGGGVSSASNSLLPPVTAGE
ncbi:MAG: hypothetical protein HKN23_10875 [Verrucomicrobiales bacterium]|nr:hypothetical protein [Verrucomicrobiales bacterium]